MECCLAHEFGHTISDQRIGMINPSGEWEINDSWKATVKKMQKTGDIYNISKYGGSDSSEAFAECFTMYVHEPDKLPDYVIKAIEEVLNAD